MEFSGFDWDEGNLAKCGRHGVSRQAVETLFNQPLALFADPAHSRKEQRFRAIGRTAGRHVFVVFTLRRSGLIRPISARYMHAKEIRAYEEENPQLRQR